MTTSRRSPATADVKFTSCSRLQSYETAIRSTPCCLKNLTVSGFVALNEKSAVTGMPLSLKYSRPLKLRTRTPAGSHLANDVNIPISDGFCMRGVAINNCAFSCLAISTASRYCRMSEKSATRFFRPNGVQLPTALMFGP